ncbi:MAG TPA: DUF1592 domain-containing protein [Polyangiaceae bacterium]|nr:DUF1592 domain-containing protein [Polyangiaceae bacterium]
MQGGSASNGAAPGTGAGSPGMSVPPVMTGEAGSSFINPSPGALARLTNVEYSQTVADLLGEPPDASVRYRFPEDPRQHGFDNNVDLLHVSTAHTDRYAAAAEAIAAATFASPARRALVLTCDPTTGAACLTMYIQTMGRRLYRRPLTADEVNGFSALAASTAVASDPTSGPQVVLQAMLLSPHFLFRVAVGVANPAQPTIVGLNGFELATRLAFFLWGTAPNDALLDMAQGGALDTPNGVASVVAQMLVDPRSRRGIKRFYGQWLPLTMISGPTADQDRVPHGDAALAADMVEETSRFVDSVFWDGGTVLDLLTAKYTFVSARLATIYGVTAPTTAATPWIRVDFGASSQRAGLLTQGTILAAGSHGTKPSNTRRGEIIREQLLCNDIPSPPPGVNANVPPAQPGETEQQTFARHTTDPSCASCHSLMDPIGWGLAGFDETGAARTKDTNGQPISVAGQIKGMVPPDFNGPTDLAQKLAQSSQFRQCFAQQLFRYAYGRVETGMDAPGIAQLEGRFEGSNWAFDKGLTALVLSDGFRYRNKGDAP